MNSVHQTIKFTCDYSQEKAIFLDVITYKSGKKLKTTLYTKPTNNHGYLAYDSCHPPHNKENIPYSQFMRIRRICSDWTEFAKNAIKLCIYFSLRGYPSEVVLNSLKRVNMMDRNQVNMTESICDDDKLILIVDYNPRNPKLLNIVQKYWPLLDRSSSTRELLKYKIMTAYRKPKSLSDMLCSTNLPNTTKKSGEKNFSICKNPGKCKICPKTIKKGTITSHSTGRKYKCVKKFSCRSENLVYCIECKNCGKQYVGQTKNQLRYRMYNHMSNVNTRSDTPVGRHFINHNSMTIYVLQLMRTDKDDIRSRISWENTWISRLNTLTPKGMNILD